MINVWYYNPKDNMNQHETTRIMNIPVQQ